MFVRSLGVQPEQDYQVFYLYKDRPSRSNDLIKMLVGVICIITVYRGGEKTFEFDSGRVYTNEELREICALSLSLNINDGR